MHAAPLPAPPCARASERTSRGQPSSRVSLTTLGLYACGIDGDGARVIAEGLEENVTLLTLLLSHNQIGDEGIKAFSTALASGALGSIETLSLASNQFGDEGMKSLASAIASGAMGKLGYLVIDNPSQVLKDACSTRKINIH